MLAASPLVSISEEDVQSERQADARRLQAIMSEGFVVVSRWGPKQHQVGCTCGVCKSRRKEQAKGFKQKFAGQSEYGSDKIVTPKPDVLRDEDSQLAVGAPSSDLPIGRPPDQTKAQSAELNISSAENEPDTANGISTASAEALLDVQQPTQLKKKALKVTQAIQGQKQIDMQGPSHLLAVNCLQTYFLGQVLC